MNKVIGFPKTVVPESGDGVCQESDGCPTERAVLQRFWREHQVAAPSPSASSVPVAMHGPYEVTWIGAGVWAGIVDELPSGLYGEKVYLSEIGNLAAPPANAQADWLPTAANINALPQPIRDYIMNLETNADPAGMVRENAILRHDNAEFESRLAANPAPSALTDADILKMFRDNGAKIIAHWGEMQVHEPDLIKGARAILQANGAKHD